jgi:hypothetical protein
MAERVEYGRQIDCEANGCKVRHSDDGYVFEWPLHDFGPPDLSEPPIVNGHACRWVQRHIPEWSPLIGEFAGADTEESQP